MLLIHVALCPLKRLWKTQETEKCIKSIIDP